MKLIYLITFLTLLSCAQGVYVLKPHERDYWTVVSEEETRITKVDGVYLESDRLPYKAISTDESEKGFLYYDLLIKNSNKTPITIDLSSIVLTGKKDQVFKANFNKKREKFHKLKAKETFSLPLLFKTSDDFISDFKWGKSKVFIKVNLKDNENPLNLPLYLWEVM